MNTFNVASINLTGEGFENPEHDGKHYVVTAALNVFHSCQAITGLIGLPVTFGNLDYGG
jgi:hypothetical protein